MALTKYISQPPTGRPTQLYLFDEFRRVEISIGTIITTLAAIGVPVELGPADSGGAGYRVLRIPN